MKVSFISSGGEVETWKFQGGAFTNAGSWKQQSSGGNKILEWVTDAATTRLQVPANERKEGMQISYRNEDGDWVNEQYIGTNLKDAYWAADDNWKKAVDTNVLPSSKRYLSRFDAEVFENVSLRPNGLLMTNANYDFYLFSTDALTEQAELSGQRFYFTFTEYPSIRLNANVGGGCEYFDVLNSTLGISKKEIRYIGLNVLKTDNKSFLIENVAGNLLVENKYLRGTVAIKGSVSDFVPSGEIRITKTCIFDLEPGKIYYFHKPKIAGLSNFVGIYNGTPSDQTLVFSKGMDSGRIVLPNAGDYKLVMALYYQSGELSYGQSLKVLCIDNINSSMDDYEESDIYVNKKTNFYEIRKSMCKQLKGANQFVDYDFDNNDPIAYNAKEVTSTLINGDMPFLVSLGGGIPNNGTYYQFRNDGEGRYIYFEYTAIQKGGTLFFLKKVA